MLPPPISAMYGEFFLEVARSEADGMIRELKANCMRVALLPAPEPRFEGHKIRGVISRPPEWYMEIYSELGRKTFKRHRFLSALERIRAGKVSNTTYQRLALRHLKERLTQ